MIVVTNSGPLIALAKLGLLYLLQRIYGQVYVPKAVYHEVVERGKEGGYSDALQTKLAVQRGQLIVVEVDENALLLEFAFLTFPGRLARCKRSWTR